MQSLVFLRASQVEKLVGYSAGKRRQLVPLTSSVPPQFSCAAPKEQRGFLSLTFEEEGECLDMSVYCQLWLFRYLMIDILTAKLAQIILHALLSKLSTENKSLIIIVFIQYVCVCVCIYTSILHPLDYVILVHYFFLLFYLKRTKT